MVSSHRRNAGPPVLFGMPYPHFSAASRLACCCWPKKCLQSGYGGGLERVLVRHGDGRDHLSTTSAAVMGVPWRLTAPPLLLITEVPGPLQGALAPHRIFSAGPRRRTGSCRGGNGIKPLGDEDVIDCSRRPALRHLSLFDRLGLGRVDDVRQVASCVANRYVSSYFCGRPRSPQPHSRSRELIITQIPDKTFQHGAVDA
jgi:hypothetical protein